MNHRRKTGLALAGFVAVLLVGCATPPESTVDPTAGPSSSPTVPVAEPAPCETLLSEEENAALAAEGRTLRDPSFLVPIVVPAQQLVDAGGLACAWGKDATDVIVFIAQGAMDESAASTLSADLAAEGWVQTDDPVLGTLVAPPAGENANVIPGAAVYSGGIFYVASYAGILGSIAALQ